MSGSARSRSARDRIFISYAREDSSFSERLLVHLKPYLRDRDLLLWFDGKIRPGAEWPVEINTALAQTRLAVLMISADFFASDFIAEQELPPLLKAAKRGEVTLLPLIVGPSDFTDSVLKDYQTLKKNRPESDLRGMRTAQREEVYNAAVSFIKGEILAKPSNRPSTALPTATSGTGKKKKGKKKPVPKPVHAKPARDGGFTKDEWRAIRSELNAKPDQYGLPRRVHGSVVFGSFNIRKFGRLQSEVFPQGRDASTMAFLADVCRQFDLLAIQEVMFDLAGVEALRELMGPQFELVVSGPRSAFPGDTHVFHQRMAFLYNRDSIERTPVIWQVSTTRTRLLRTLALHHHELYDVMERDTSARRLRTYHTESLPQYEKDLRDGSRRKRPKEPALRADVAQFLQFTQPPFAVGFRIRSYPGVEPLELMALNVDTPFGSSLRQRRAEVAALLQWVFFKLQSAEVRSVMLFGDLFNFDFDKPDRDLAKLLTALESEVTDIAEEIGIGFPFVFPHPKRSDIFRTNVHLNQTFDQIGVISTEDRLVGQLATGRAGHLKAEVWGSAPQGPDYGVFNFANLFSCALNEDRKLRDLKLAERRAFLRRFEFRVSDHLPVWLRLPLPSYPPSGFFPTG